MIQPQINNSHLNYAIERPQDSWRFPRVLVLVRRRHLAPRRYWRRLQEPWRRGKELRRVYIRIRRLRKVRRRRRERRLVVARRRAACLRRRPRGRGARDGRAGDRAGALRGGRRRDDVLSITTGLSGAAGSLYRRAGVLSRAAAVPGAAANTSAVRGAAAGRG